MVSLLKFFTRHRSVIPLVALLLLGVTFLPASIVQAAVSVPSYGVLTSGSGPDVYAQEPNGQDWYATPDASPFKTISILMTPVSGSLNSGAAQVIVNWYNQDGTYISGVQVILNTTVTAPTNAYYFAISWVSGPDPSEYYVPQIVTNDATYTVPEPSTFPSGSLTTPQPTGAVPYVGNMNALALLDPGTLSLTAPTLASSLSPITLNGQVQTSVATFSPWSVTDATGTGDGWNVQVQASQFTEIAPSSGFATGSFALTLPSGSLSLTGSRSVIAGSGSTPVSTTGGPNFAVNSLIVDQSSPEVLLTASSGYGLGTYTVQEPTNGLALTINPSTTKVDETNYPNQPTPYQSVITFNAVSGP